MTEEEWLATTNLNQMLQNLRPVASDRKLRLFAIACCGRFPELLTNGHSRQAIEAMERFADGQVGETEIRAMNVAMEQWLNQRWASRRRFPPEDLARILTVSRGDAWSRAFGVCSHCVLVAGELAWKERLGQGRRRQRDARKQRWRQEEAGLAALLKEIFNNPFHVPNIDPRWLTSNTVDLARTIYEERSFDRLPILADALMDAGCADDSILSHCRSEGPHVRGCWVVDLVLGKT
jgi:hypothetical protein